MNWTLNSWETPKGSHGGSKQTCMVMEAQVMAEKKDIDCGLTPPKSSIGIAFYGRQRTSCEFVF